MCKINCSGGCPECSPEDHTGIHYCEYHDCEEEGTTYDEALLVWLCDRHYDMCVNTTIWCGEAVKL